MLTVKEVSRLSGVSIRTLHYYDALGLLVPAVTTAAGYRLYSGADLERLQQILLYRELEFPLKDIKRIIDSPDFDRSRALDQQIELLRLRREHIDGLISFAEQLRTSGGDQMSFQAFDTEKMDRYADEAKKTWGGTEAFREYERKTRDDGPEEQARKAEGLMDIFREFGTLRGREPESGSVQQLTAKLQAYITEHYYTCTKQILAGLGQMYAAGGEMTENIDAAGGAGTAALAAEAIRFWCR